MTSAEWIWLIMGAGLIVYALTGGADFGGGVWDLLAFGPRKEEQRKAIEKAIAPIWEANHVWLIFIIVLCFSTFTHAFYVLSVALHVPITLALFGIVLRGVSFVFRIYGKKRLLWGRIFAWSSVLTPVFLGMILGALATGEIRYKHPHVTSGFWTGFTSPFAFFVGLFALVLFALLAAVYLAAETSGKLQEDFRKRSFIAEVIAGIGALCVLFFAQHAPPIWRTFVQSPWFIGWQTFTALCVLGVFVGLWKRYFLLAKIAVIAQMILIILGFGFSMRGYLVYPDVTLINAGLHTEIVSTVWLILLCGSVLLIPSLWYLFKIFHTTNRT